MALDFGALAQQASVGLGCARPQIIEPVWCQK